MVINTDTRISQDEFGEVYKAVMTNLLDNDSAFSHMVSKLKDFLDDGAFSAEIHSQILGQFFSSAYSTMEGQANASTLHILDTNVQSTMLDANIAQTKAQKLQTDAQKLQTDAQTAQVKRETQGFNDNLKIKKAEFNGQVASFAVNAGASNAQAVVNRFNTSIDNLI